MGREARTVQTSVGSSPTGSTGVLHHAGREARTVSDQCGFESHREHLADRVAVQGDALVVGLLLEERELDRLVGVVEEGPAGAEDDRMGEQE